MPAQPRCKPPDWSDPENLKAFSWCINHGITIGALAAGPGWYNASWFIEITVDKKKITSPSEYGKNEVWDKVFELYKYYYNKYKDG